MGVVPVVIVDKNVNNPFNMFGDLAGFAPSSEIIQAMGTFLPRIMNKKTVKLDKTMIPKDSILKHVYEDDDDDISPFDSAQDNKNSNDNQDYVRMSQHQIRTPFGEVHIKSMSKTFVKK